MSEQPKPKPQEWWVGPEGKRVQIVGLGRDMDDSGLTVVCREPGGGLWVTRYRDWSRKVDGAPRFSQEG